MRWHLTRFAALALALAAGARAGAANNAATTAGTAPDPYVLAARIDALINEHLKKAGVAAAPKADDAEFLRRAMLDLHGRVALPREYYDLTTAKDAQKRRQLVDKLLDGPGYVNHFTDVYRNLYLPETMANVETVYFQFGFDNWLRKKFQSNTPYDVMARELITAQISNRGNQYINPYGGQENPLAFFSVKEAKPENIASSVTKIFLGIQIECAQCHNHPFARWSREQFWGTAAFFAGIERTQPNFYSPMREVYDRREIAIPNTDKVVQASFLDDKEPQWKFQTSSRVTFAEWMTAPDNPYFARTAVNRLWAHFFGIGIVDPVDDFNDENKASHPELLDELAKAFVAAKYDMKYMIRAITATEAYQRTSTLTDSSQSNPRLYARMPVKGMTGEQLFDSLAMTVGYRDPYPKNTPAVFFGGNSPRADFVAKFNSTSKVTETQTSILQALMLMNGKFLADATSIDKSETLAAVSESPFMDTGRKIETLYLAALGRKPRPEELQKLVKHVETGDPAKQKQRLGDVFWTLLNSVEFRVNH
ncbi:MAG: DUF1553 domain-containing protein [Gemmataceae bacterium]